MLERVSGHQANIHPALNASERTTTRVPGFEPGTFGFLDRCDGDARRDVSVDKHDSDQEKYTTGGARTSLHTLGDMDPLLAQLVSQWDTLPGPVRKAIAALLECDQWLDTWARGRSDALIQIFHQSGPGIPRYQGRSGGESVPPLYCPIRLVPLIDPDPLGAAKGPTGCQHASNRATLPFLP